MSHSAEFEHDGEALRVQLDALGEDRYLIKVGDREHEVTARALPDGRVRFVLGDKTFHCATANRGTQDVKRRKDVHVALDGATWMLRHAVAGGGSGGGGVAGDGTIVAPMTGTVLKVLVKPGDEVAALDTVAVVSAMKMEHKLLAGVDGVVESVAFAEGATVDQDVEILKITPNPAAD